MGLGTTMTVVNNTASQKQYLGGIVTVAASSTANVIDAIVSFLAFDFNFQADLIAGNVTLQDTADATYAGQSAMDLLVQRWVQGRPANLSNNDVGYVLAKQTFFITIDQSFANTNETVVLFMKNPNASSFKVRLLKNIVSADSTQGIVTTRIYTNPTTTANGTSISSQNSLIGDSTASSINCFTGPTVTSNGTKCFSFVTNSPDTESLNMNQTIILPPGNQFLITAQAANLGLLASVTTHYFIQWIEI